MGYCEQQDQIVKYSEEYLEAAHDASSNHKMELFHSEQCGCFYCLEVYDPKEIKEWVGESHSGLTAVCPKCGIDSVIPSSSGYPVNDRKFLEEMHQVWF